MLLFSPLYHAVLVSPQHARGHFWGAKTIPFVLHGACGVVSTGRTKST